MDKLLLFALLAIAASLVGFQAMAEMENSPSSEGMGQKEVKDMKKLNDLEFAPRATSHIGALEGCLKYLGIEVSPGWLFGSTGHAFILNIGDDLCGSGPHSWGWGIVNKLGQNIGYKAEAVYTNVNKDDFAQMQEKAWDFARKSIDDGFPCYGWHYDFMVINGYDDNGYLLSGPVDDAPGDWRKFGAGAVGFLEIWSIRPGEKADDKTTIKDALSFAADMAKEPDKRTIDKGTGGLAGYDNWIKGLESGKGDAFGGAYNAAIWAECRRFAVEFLEEANERTGRELNDLFQPAIDQYKIVSDSLKAVADLFPYKNATEAEWKQNMEDEERRQKAVEHLKIAKAAEAEGVKLLGKIVEAMQTETAYQQYGFRYDPMNWAESDETLQGALVRTIVLNKPQDGDQGRIDEAINKILAEQRDDGSFGEEGKETANKICELIELGYPAEKPEIQRAVDVIVQLVKDKKAASKPFDEFEEQPMGIGIMWALCLTGRTDLPELHKTLRWYADHFNEWLNRGCPWGQSQTIVALSAGRQVIDIEEGFEKALKWVADSINGAGCLSYFDPWSFVRLAGIVDHPLTQTIVEKQLTLILRSQYPNGGWDVPIQWATNQSSLNAFRALEKHGMLEELRHRPPLPPGWEIAQSIPAPEGDLWGLAWDGEKWWMCDDETHSAIAISPEDGKIIKKVKLPEGNGRGFGWWDGAIALNQGSPWEKDSKRLVKVDPDTGKMLQEIPLDMLNHAGGVTQVNGNAWVVDSFFGCLMSLDASGQKVRSNISLAGPLPVAIAPDNGDLWHDDLWVPFFIKSGLDHDGQYLDCIEKPFREPFAPKPYGGVVRGMGHDGKNLWVLDNSNKLIVMLKKRGME